MFHNANYLYNSSVMILLKNFNNEFFKNEMKKKESKNFHYVIDALKNHAQNYILTGIFTFLKIRPPRFQFNLAF